ncbi:MAG: hypothetical protein M1336_05415 [Deltaproteobacteria bacterium]|nr:hypothetical protein [Deltaproteobacteria bacterium]
MARLLGDTLPPEFVSAFDGTNLEAKLGLICLGVSVDPDGCPRAFMLSAGEVLVVGPRAVRLALWPKSRTADNLGAGGAVLLGFMAPRTVLYAKGTVRRLGMAAAGADVECFEIEVNRVESDLHEGFPLVQGPRYACEDADPAEVVRGWQKTLTALRRFP